MLSCLSNTLQLPERSHGEASMRRPVSILAVLTTLLVSAPISWSQSTATKPEILTVRKIWDRAPHNAFTDMTFHQGRFLWRRNEFMAFQIRMRITLP